MIHHTVLLKLLPTVTAAQKATLLATILEKLGPSLPGTAAAAGEPIFTERAGGYELGIYRQFKDVEEFQAYRVHPAHVELVTGALKESVESMVSFQIQA